MLLQKKQQKTGQLIGVLCSLFVLMGCQTEKKTEIKNLSFQKTTRNTLLVATSDYQSGELVQIDLVAGHVNKSAIGIHSDAVVRSFFDDSFLFVVNRLGADNIQWIRQNDHKDMGQFSVGKLSNPQDIAVVDENIAYVSRLANNRLLKINPFTGETLKEIDLFELSDPNTKISSDSDGNPEMTWMKLWKGQLLVLLQRLNSDEGYTPSNGSQLAVLDLKDDKVHKFVELGSPNPVTRLTELNGNLVLGEAGALGVLDGKIEVFDENLNAKRTISTEKQLGGDIIDCLLVNSNQGVAVVVKNVDGRKPQTRLVSFSIATGEINSVLKDTENLSLHQLVADEERKLFYLADRDPKTPGIWVFDSQTLKLFSDTKYDVGLPPYHMELIK